MNVGETLNKCADLFSKPGTWLQNEWKNEEGTAFCALGAIDHFTGVEIGEYSAVRMALGNFLFPDFKLDYPSIVPWNNNPKRTQEEVVQAFRGAAELWEKEHKELVEV